MHGMIRKQDEIIDSLEAWRRLAPPKSPVQWQDGRSAKESARAWLTALEKGSVPREVADVLGSHEDFGEILEWEGEPESLVAFDDFSGPANIDVLLRARDASGEFVVAVEAKADESFGALVSRALSAALERRLQNGASKGMERIQQLVEHVLPPATKGAPRLHQIRYQLLTATAAALAAARRREVGRAVLLVHEFRTRRVDARYLARNRTDLVRFLRRLGAEDAERVSEGALIGPLRVPGTRGDDGAPALYVGKAVREVFG